MSGLFVYIPQVIFFAAVVVLLIILGRKIPVVRKMDVTVLAREDQQGRLFQKGVSRGVITTIGLASKRLVGRIVNAFWAVGVKARQVIDRFRKPRPTEAPSGGIVSSTSPAMSDIPKPKAVAKTIEKKEEEKKPERAQELIQEGDKALKEKDYLRAEKAFIEVVTEHDSHSKGAYKELGKLYREKGNLGDAQASWDQVLTLDAEDVEALSSLGQIHLDEHRYAKALDMFERALEIDPNNKDFINQIGTIAFRINDRKLAKSMLTRLLRLDPENTKAKERLEKIKKDTKADNRKRT